MGRFLLSCVLNLLHLLPKETAGHPGTVLFALQPIEQTPGAKIVVVGRSLVSNRKLVIGRLLLANLGIQSQFFKLIHLVDRSLSKSLVVVRRVELEPERMKALMVHV